MADARDIGKILGKIVDKVVKEVNINLPRKVGVIAKNHFTDNFRKGGFVNGGLHKWQTTKRQQMGGNGADAKYSPLTSRRDHLMRGIVSRPGVGQVTIRTDVLYADIHNEGGNTHPKVTPKMRKFAWAQVYSLAGMKKGKGKGKGKGKKLPKQLPPQAEMWKRIALTKKGKLNIRIVKRQFMGDSKELNDKIDKLIISTINNLTNGISSL